jgi:hypothetical protein
MVKRECFCFAARQTTIVFGDAGALAKKRLPVLNGPSGSGPSSLPLCVQTSESAQMTGSGTAITAVGILSAVLAVGQLALSRIS